VLLVGAVPLSRLAARTPPARAARLEVRAGDGAPQQLDPRRDADLHLDGPLGPTRLRVRDGAAWIDSAPCRNQLCRRQGRIARPGRSLVCIPNRIVVRFVGAEAEVDAISR
jgi:hypothetical protein